MHLRARIIVPNADTFGTKLTRAPRERRTSTGVRDHRHSLPVVVADTLATLPARIAAIAHTFGFRSLAPGTRSSWIPPVPTTAGRQPLLRSTHADAQLRATQPGALAPVSGQAERAIGVPCLKWSTVWARTGRDRRAALMCVQEPLGRPRSRASSEECGQGWPLSNNSGAASRHARATASDASDPGRIAQSKGAPTDAGRPLNSGLRRARIRRASVGVCKSSSTFHASRRDPCRFAAC